MPYSLGESSFNYKRQNVKNLITTIVEVRMFRLDRFQIEPNQNSIIGSISSMNIQRDNL